MSDTDTTTSTPIRDVTIVRSFDAPVERIWDAWIDPDQFAHWFGAELEVPKESLDWNVRQGAAWRANMLQDGSVVPFAGDFLEVVEPSRLVISFDGTYSEPPIDERQVLTVTMVAIDSGATEVTLHQEGPMPDGMQDGLTHGYNAFMDRLQTLLPA